MRSGGTLGMGLKNIYEQLHSSFLNVAPQVTQKRKLKEAQYCNGSARHFNNPRRTFSRPEEGGS
jgi:hypothetical protein